MSHVAISRWSKLSKAYVRFYWMPGDNMFSSLDNIRFIEIGFDTRYLTKIVFNQNAHRR